jgi:hypothetical protein
VAPYTTIYIYNFAVTPTDARLALPLLAGKLSLPSVCTTSRPILPAAATSAAVSKHTVLSVTAQLGLNPQTCRSNTDLAKRAGKLYTTVFPTPQQQVANHWHIVYNCAPLPEQFSSLKRCCPSPEYVARSHTLCTDQTSTYQIKP